MPTPVPTAATTAGLIQAAQGGQLRKSNGGDTLIDQNGNVVANRIGAQGGCDYYADAQQGFPAGGRTICIRFSQPAGNISICDTWGDQF